jgi:hypothetical protein
MKRHGTLPWLLIVGLAALPLTYKAMQAPSTAALPDIASTELLDKRQRLAAHRHRDRGNIIVRDAADDAPLHRQRPRLPAREEYWSLASVAQRRQAVSIVRAQLDAFKKGDYQRALSYQSSGLRHNFMSARDFRRIIRSSYAHFAEHRSVSFGTVRFNKRNQMLSVPITLLGDDGILVRARYWMVREGNTYRIQTVSGGTPSQAILDEPQPIIEVSQAQIRGE